MQACRSRAASRCRALLASLLSIGSAFSALGNDVSWISSRAGSWSLDANWLGGAPHSGDNATFSSGIGTIDQNFSLGNFVLSGGVIQGGNSISTSGTFTWSGGRLAGSGGTLNSNGTMLITGSTFIDGRILNNAGTAIWSAGDIQPYQLPAANTLNNLAGATFSIQSDHDIAAFHAGATLSFNNAGYLRKELTTGTTRFGDASLFNSGTVDVQTGTLALSFGSNSGTFNVASGAAISFDTYSFDPGTSFTGGGAVLLGGGSSFNTDVTFGSNLTLTSTSASIDGTGRVTIAGQFELERGDLFGSGTLQINSAATMNVSSAADTSHYLFRNIDNNGTINWSGTANIETGRGAVVNNAGTWNFTADQELDRPTSGNVPAMTINNSGTLSKSAGAGSTLIEVAITNTGTISVTSGVLNLGFGGTSESGSTIRIGSNSTLRFSGSAFWIKDGTNFGDSGTLDVSLGSLRASSSLLSGAHVLMNGFELGIDGDLDDNQFSWNRGELSGPGTTTLTADHTFGVPWGVGAGRTLNTNGHNLTWNGSFWGSGFGASLFGYSGAGTIENRAGSTFSVNLTNTVNTIANGSDIVVLNNAGTYTQNATTIQLSGALNNSGTVLLSDGTLVLMGGGNDSGTFTGSGTLALNGGSHNFGSTSTIDSLFLNVQSGTAALNNTTAGAYTTSGVSVGDAISSANLTIPANVAICTTDFTALAGSNVQLSGGAIDADNSVVLDQAADDLREDGGISLTNGGSISASQVSVRHATLDLQSGTISADSFEVTGGTVNFGGGGHVVTSNLSLTGGAVNVSPGFAWPTSTFDCGGSSINLQNGVNYSFPAASTISAGSVFIAGGATLSVDSMSHAGASEVQGRLDVTHNLTLVGASITVSNHGMISAGSISGDAIIALSDGTIATTSGMTLGSSSYLTGSGTISGNLQHGGALIPGDMTSQTPGDITVTGDLQLQSTAQSLFQIDASTPAIHVARVEVGGTTTLGGLLFIGLSGDPNHLSATTPIVIVHSSDGISGIFSKLVGGTTMESLPEGAIVDGIDLLSNNVLAEFTIHYGANDVQLNYVPEPSSATTFLLLPMILSTRRKRRR